MDNEALILLHNNIENEDINKDFEKLFISKFLEKHFDFVVFHNGEKKTIKGEVEYIGCEDGWYMFNVKKIEISDFKECEQKNSLVDECTTCVNEFICHAKINSESCTKTVL